MQVQRTRHTRAYVQISNDIARHSRLSLEAVGLLTRLLSMPDGSGATVEKITEKVPNGRRSVSRAMNELVAEGFVKRAKVQDPETGQWVTITTVTDSPTDHMPTVGLPTGQVVGGSPKEKDAKRKTSLPKEPEQRPAGRDDSEGEESPAGNTTTAKAVACLGSLGSREPRLRLSLAESMRLAPLAAEWLSEGFSEAEIGKTLTKALPASVESAAALVTYRLRNLKPEAPTAAVAAPVTDLRLSCPECGVKFPLGHSGGLCRPCADIPAAKPDASRARVALSGAARVRATLSR
ncbi:hypothetical protein [Streptomyces wuyuanensis]|uniref:hypothetical protein n=1 Tax=Streptomyces wuyuanensis TaxID=1196353 RepID=UPI0034242991